MQTSEKMKAVLFLIAVTAVVSTAMVVRNNHRLKKRIGRQAPVNTPLTDCVCMAFSLCSANYTRNPNGITLIDIRHNNFSPCEHYLDVCCRMEDMLLHFTPSTIEPSPNKPSSSSLFAYNLLPNSTASGSTVIPTSTDSTTPTSLSTSDPIPTDNASSIALSTDTLPSTPLPETNISTFNASSSNNSLPKGPTGNDSVPDSPVSDSPLLISPSDNEPSSNSQSTSSQLPSFPTTDVPLSISTTSRTLSLNSAITISSTSSNLPPTNNPPPISPSTEISLSSSPINSNPSPSSPNTDEMLDSAPNTETSSLLTIPTTEPLPTPPSISSPLINLPITNTSSVSTSHNDESLLPNSSTSSISKLILPSNIPSTIPSSSNSPFASFSTTEVPSANSPAPETNKISTLQTTNTLLSSTPATDTSPSNVPTSSFLSPDTLTSTIPLSNSPPSNASLPILPATASPSSTQSGTNDKSSANKESLTKDPDSLANPPRAVTKDNYVSRGCGYSNNYGIGFRIIGNKLETQFAEFPWVVALLRDDEFICGGSLIHPKVVLTGAHCVRGASIKKFVARAGDWDRNTTKEIIPHQDRKIDEIIEHEDFHSGALLNDVALLILKEPLNLADNVDVVCLPTQNFEFGEMDGCLASGWGKDNMDSQSYQQILKKVYVPLVESRDTCQTMLRKTRLGPTFELDESFICAGGKDQDTCKGDGGGPLMCRLREDSSRFIQAGIVAWGIGCGDGTPGVYAKVSHFRDWIDSQLEKRGIVLKKT